MLPRSGASVDSNSSVILGSSGCIFFDPPLSSNELTNEALRNDLKLLRLSQSLNIYVTQNSSTPGALPSLHEATGTLAAASTTTDTAGVATVIVSFTLLVLVLLYAISGHHVQPGHCATGTVVHVPVSLYPPLGELGNGCAIKAKREQSPTNGRRKNKKEKITAPCHYWTHKILAALQHYPAMLVRCQLIRVPVGKIFEFRVVSALLCCNSVSCISRMSRIFLFCFLAKYVR